ncbi:MAG: NAD(P)H-dependent oxidoreductase [Christensenellales bacterium]|jgi:multimeric flavodoxin WrbA
MRYLMIHAGPRRDNAWNIFLQTHKQVVEQGASHIRQVLLSTYDIPQCRQCALCLEKDETHCPDHEVVSSLIKDFCSCDMLVLITPIYRRGFPSTVVSWIEHLAYMRRRPSAVKTPLLVVGISRRRWNFRPMAGIVPTIRRLGFEHVDTLHLSLPAAEGLTDPASRKKLLRKIRRFTKKAQDGRLPHILNVTAYSRLRASMAADPKQPGACYWSDALQDVYPSPLPRPYAWFAAAAYGFFTGWQIVKRRAKDFLKTAGARIRDTLRKIKDREPDR